MPNKSDKIAWQLTQSNTVMSGKSGPGVPKNLKKVKPGYDQAFTLPKGTSAAPIKQVAKGSS